MKNNVSTDLRVVRSSHDATGAEHLLLYRDRIHTHTHDIYVNVRSVHMYVLVVGGNPTHTEPSRQCLHS